jgi:hypothetical protein
MEHEMSAIEELVFVTKLSFVPAQPHTGTRRKGFGLTFRALFAGGMPAAERGKSKQFNSRGSAQRCSPAYRSCKNACRIVMALGALKMLPKKLLPMPSQLLQ